MSDLDGSISRKSGNVTAFIQTDLMWIPRLAARIKSSFKGERGFGCVPVTGSCVSYHLIESPHITHRHTHAHKTAILLGAVEHPLGVPDLDRVLPNADQTRPGWRFLVYWA